MSSHERRDPEQDVFRIDLLSKGKPPQAPPNAGATPAPAESPASGMTLQQLLNNYQAIVQARAIYYPAAFHFVRELGRGRQGQVFLGLRQGARGCVTEHAIKVFDPQLYRSPEEYWTDMGRIASQVSRLQRMQSPNLVSNHSYEETYGIGYVQMDAIDGMDLRRLLSQDHLDIARQRSTAREWAIFTKTIFRIEGQTLSLQPGVAVYILRGMLRGIERLHAMGFLHSDIKPGNIMIDRLGNVKVVDFGRAAVIGEKVSFLLGSPLYMAPEIHRREAGGTSSDFYSVGLVALEMLRGKPLTVSSNASETELEKLKRDLPNGLPHLLPPHVLVNKPLVAILRKFIEPDPTRRYSSARDAEVGDDGLRVIHKQLVQVGLDSEYARDVSEYLAKLVDAGTNRIETPVVGHPETDRSGT